ncbi:hypothetical protein Emag_007080 [Eimeria magna]
MEASCMQRSVPPPLGTPAKKLRTATGETGATAAAATAAATADTAAIAATAAESQEAPAAAKAEGVSVNKAQQLETAAEPEAAATAAAAAATGNLEGCCSPSVETPSTRASAIRWCCDSGVDSETDTPTANWSNHPTASTAAAGAAAAAVAAAAAPAALAGSPTLVADRTAANKSIREGEKGGLQSWAPNTWRVKSPSSLLQCLREPFSSGRVSASLHKAALWVLEKFKEAAGLRHLCLKMSQQSRGNPREILWILCSNNKGE